MYNRFFVAFVWLVTDRLTSDKVSPGDKTIMVGLLKYLHLAESLCQQPRRLVGHKVACFDQTLAGLHQLHGELSWVDTVLSPTSNPVSYSDDVSRTVARPPRLY